MASSPVRLRGGGGDEPPATFEESLERCRTRHDHLTFRRTNRRFPAACDDCGQLFTQADLFALLIEFIEAGARPLRRRIEALEAALDLAGIERDGR